MPLGLGDVGGLGQAEAATEGGLSACRHGAAERGVTGLLTRKNTAVNGVDISRHYWDLFERSGFGLGS